MCDTLRNKFEFMPMFATCPRGVFLFIGHHIAQRSGIAASRMLRVPRFYRVGLEISMAPHRSVAPHGATLDSAALQCEDMLAIETGSGGGDGEDVQDVKGNL